MVNGNEYLTTTAVRISTTITNNSIFIQTLLAGLLFVIPYYYYYHHYILRKNKNDKNTSINDDDDNAVQTSSTSSSLTINPCPNPNCVRCQKYKEIQMSAKRRLPHLIHYWKRSYSEVNTEMIECDDNKQRTREQQQQQQQQESNRKFQLQRIMDGVMDNKNNYRASGQHPTVLFIPRLSIMNPTKVHVDVDEHVDVPSIVTHLHSDTCNSFLNENNGDGDDIRDVMLQEYCNSQFNNAQWMTNNAAGTSNISYSNDNNNSNDNNDHDHLWEVLYLMNQGNWIKDNINKYCPNTFSFLNQKLNNALMQNCIFGNIFFSVLYPGTHIEPHCGPTNIRHRLHFALSVPESSSGLRRRKNDDTSKNNDDDNNVDNSNSPILKVRNEILKWEDGKTFVFDDSLVHSAEYPNDRSGNNGSDGEVRVVLVVDLWHPSLSVEERDLLSGLYPPI